MTRRDASKGRAPVRPNVTTATPPRDLNDAELSEAIDTDREQRDDLLHADWSWCPTCRESTLSRRDGTCLFCDGPTLPHDLRDARVSTSSQCRGRFSTAQGSVAAGESTTSNKEAA